MRKLTKQWSQKEIDFIVSNANKMSCYDLGLKLGRSEQSVSHKLERIGIKKKSFLSKTKKHKKYKHNSRKGWRDELYIGKTFGCWKVISRGDNNSRQPYYLCEDEQGNRKLFRQDYLRDLINPIKENIDLSLFKPTKYKDIYASENGDIVRVWKYINGGTRIKKFTPSYINDGYVGICFSINGKHQTKAVHRIIAETFIPNPNNLPMINHKDENKENNHINNLEWCTAQYNNTYGTRIERAKRTIYENRIKKQNGLVRN